MKLRYEEALAHWGLRTKVTGMANAIQTAPLPVEAKWPMYVQQNSTLTSLHFPHTTYWRVSLDSQNMQQLFLYTASTDSLL
jgi:hypothetical protein